MSFPRLDRREFLQVSAEAIAATPFTPQILGSLLAQSEIRFNSTVLYYHEINAGQLTADILGFIDQGIPPISLENFVWSLQGLAPLPDGPTFMITCDDGYLSQYTEGLKAVDNIQRLRDVFVPVTFFAIMRFNGQSVTEDLEDTVVSFSDGNPNHRYMHKGQLIDLIQQGHFVEDHTADHIPLPSISGDRLVAQVEVAEEKVNALWDLAGRERTVRVFAYPNGLYRGREAFIEDEGFDAAFSTVAVTSHSSLSRFRLGRFRRS